MPKKRPGLVQGFKVESRMRYNPEQKAVFNFVPGVMTLILMLIAAMMTSITIAQKRSGRWKFYWFHPCAPFRLFSAKQRPISC